MTRSALAACAVRAVFVSFICPTMPPKIRLPKSDATKHHTMILVVSGLRRLGLMLPPWRAAYRVGFVLFHHLPNDRC